MSKTRLDTGGLPKQAPLSPDQWVLPDAGFSTTNSQGSTSQVWLGVRIPPGSFWQYLGLNPALPITNFVTLSSSRYLSEPALPAKWK